jgi:hypothetical protein
MLQTSDFRFPTSVYGLVVSRGKKGLSCCLRKVHEKYTCEPLDSEIDQENCPRDPL